MTSKIKKGSIIKKDPIKASFGTWRYPEDSVKFVRDIRADSERRRMKRLKI